MNKMVTAFLAIGVIIALLPAVAFGSPSSPAPSITASVAEVVGIDSIVVRILTVSDTSPVSVGDTVHIHLIGIELTESGKALLEENEDMLISKTVYLAIDSASTVSWQGGNEPLSAYVYLDPEGQTLVNSMLITMGLAKQVTSSTSTNEATSLATSNAQAEDSSTGIGEASTDESRTATAQISLATPEHCTPVTTNDAQPCRCCCCMCACPTPEPINVLRLTSCVRHGNYAKLEIEAVPGAWYQIDVGYPSYLSTDLNLGSQAGCCGVVRWRWKIYEQTPPGTWPITVTARLDGQIIGRLRTSITVRR